MTHLPVIQLRENVLWSKDSALRQPCRKVDVTDADDLAAARSLITEMFKTLYADPSGVALAAPQVGILLQVVTINYQDRDEKQPRVIALINPDIVAHDELTESTSEICLSVPNKSGTVSRFKTITVEAFDHNGMPTSITASGFFARVLQHEIDHLNGILYVDHLEDELTAIPDYPERRAGPTLRKLGLTK